VEAREAAIRPEGTSWAEGATLAAVRDLNRLLARGVPARVVMEVLGHSQIGVTMNIYSHVMPTQLTQAADAMESALWGQDR
jgi:integrase